MLFFFYFFIGYSVKLSHVNALLPFRSDKTRKLPSFIISNLDDSCVDWSSSNPSVIKITPLYEGKCSRRAKIEVLYSGPTRMNSIIYAEGSDKTKSSCNVYTDEIATIEILTSTRTIYVNSLPQQISLQGFDKKQNIFTSIGESCEWSYDTKLFAIDKSTNNNNNKNIFNPIISLKGIAVGKSLLKAQLNDLDTQIELTVVEQISLLPYNYIKAFPGVQIPFKLCAEIDFQDTQKFTKNSKCKKDIKNMNQYTFTSNQQLICSINRKTGIASTLQLGVATIHAMDSLSDENMATTIVNVTLPSSATQDIQYIIKGETPVFSPKAFDENGQELYGSDQIKWEVEGDYSKIGENTVYLRYWTFSFPCIVVVCEPISIYPPLAILPIDSEFFTFQIYGGTQKFTYEVQNKDMIEILGQQIRSKSVYGETKFIVKDKLLPSLIGEAKIVISRIKKVELELNDREIYVGESFNPLCTFISEYNNMNFSVFIPHEIISTNIIVLSTSSLEGKSEGFSTLYCNVKGIRSNEIKVSVINRLSFSFQGRASPKSRIPLHYNGGPLKWTGLQDPEISIICNGATAHTFQNYFVVDNEFSGFCSLNIQNHASYENPHPLMASTPFFINVSNVRSLAIYPVDGKGPTHENCNSVPTKLIQERVSVYNAISNHMHHFYVFCYDKHNHIINYYSNNLISLTIDNFPIERVSIDEDSGASVFKSIITKNANILAHTDNAVDYSLVLNVIYPLVVESEKTTFLDKSSNVNFAINGGSGYFSVKGSNAKITNTSLIVQPHSLGHFTYYISDICTDQEPVTAQLDVVSIRKLEINAPSIAILNNNITITVNCYSEKGKLIPPELLETAKITLNIPTAIKTSPNSWMYHPSELGSQEVIASSESSAKASKSILVISPLTASPQHIVLLPKESITISINGPSDYILRSDDESIAKAVGNSIVGISPGNTTAKITVASVDALTLESIPPFNIYIRVLTPIQLIPHQSTKSIIEGGSMLLTVKLLTDDGIRAPLSPEWNVPVQWTFTHVNMSSILLTNVKQGTIQIRVSDFNLNTEFSINVEPKFELNIPQMVIISPGSSLTISSQSNIPFILQSSGSLLRCEGHRLISNGIQGIETVTATSGTQTIVFGVEIIQPAALIFTRTAHFTFRAILLDGYGRNYTSLQGVKLSISGTGFTASDFDENGYIQLGSMSNDALNIHVSAKTDIFLIESSQSLIISSSISPKDPVLLEGSTVPFYCSSAHVQWSVSNNNVGYVTKTGVFNAVNTGLTTLSCDKTTTTEITVVSLNDIEIKKVHPDHFQVVPMYNIKEPNSFVQKPADFTFTCSWDSNKCGNVKVISNSTGYFCIVERQYHHKCPEYSFLTATMESRSTNLKIAKTSRIPFVGLVDFGFPNEHIVKMTSTNRKAVLSFLFNENDITFEEPSGWSISFQNRDAIIRAPKSFKGSQVITFTHKQSGERTKVIFSLSDNENDNENVQTYDSKPVTDNKSPIIHQRDDSTSNYMNILFIIIGLLIFISLGLLFLCK